MSARRKTQRKRKRPVQASRKRTLLTPREKRGRIAKYALLLVGVILVFVYLTSSSNYWDSSQKLSVSYPRDDGSVGVAVFDPSLDEISVVIIPEDTEITTAHQLGVWKIKSLWELGKDEKLRGTLLSESITNHMQMPVNAWADNRFESVVEGTTRDVFPAIFLTSSNLGLLDKVKVGLFAVGLKNARFHTINLEKTGFLEDITLTDGTLGYTLYGSIPEELAAVFTANVYSNHEVTARIIDGTSASDINDDVGTVLQVLGIKVAAVKDGSHEELDCIVRGENPQYLDVVAHLFNCSVEVTSAKTSFDIEFEFGNAFAERF